MSKVLGYCAFVLLCVTLLAGTAVAATTPPTVKQVNDQVLLIGEDTRAAIQGWATFNPEGAQPACQAQVDHVAALRAMVRPKRYPKATWKILKRGADLYAKVASECVAAAQAELAGHDAAALDAYIAGYKQAKPEWDAANALFTKASAALAKAKIR
jgi:hypothetical protein